MNKAIMVMAVFILVVGSVTAYTLSITVDGQSYEKEISENAYSKLQEKLAAQGKTIQQDMTDSYAEQAESDYLIDLKKKVRSRIDNLVSNDNIAVIENLDSKLTTLCSSITNLETRIKYCCVNELTDSEKTTLGCHS